MILRVAFSERVPDTLAVLERLTETDLDPVADPVPVRDTVLVDVPDPVVVPVRLTDTLAVPVTLDVEVLEGIADREEVREPVLEEDNEADAETDRVPLALAVPDSEGVPDQLLGGVGVHRGVKEDVADDDTLFDTLPLEVPVRLTVMLWLAEEVLVGVGEGLPPVVLVAVLDEVRLDEEVRVPDPVADALRDGRPLAVPDPVPLTLGLAVVVALTERVAAVVLDADEVAVADLEGRADHVVLREAVDDLVGRLVGDPRALAVVDLDFVLEPDAVAVPEDDFVPRPDLEDVLVPEELSDARGDTVIADEADDDLLDVTVVVLVRLAVAVRLIVEEVVPVRDDVTDSEILALAVGVLESTADRVLVGEIKEEAEGRDDTVASAVAAADLVAVAVRVAVRLLVAVRVGKILFSKRYLPLPEMTHEGTSFTSTAATASPAPAARTAAASPRSMARLILLRDILKWALAIQPNKLSIYATTNEFSRLPCGILIKD